MHDPTQGFVVSRHTASNSWRPALEAMARRQHELQYGQRASVHYHPRMKVHKGFLHARTHSCAHSEQFVFGCLFYFF